MLGAITTRLAKHQVVAQQYTTERQRAEALQKKVQELQEYAESKDELLQKLQQELHNPVPKLNMAIQMLKKLQPGAQRDRCLKILQASCTEEIALLNQMPDLQEFLSPESAALLRQLDRVDN